MRYFSTRNVQRDAGSAKTFEQAVLAGFADDDGGLYVPEKIPQLSLDDILQWKHFPYWRIAADICHLFAGGDETETLDKTVIYQICQKAAVETFDCPSTIKLSALTGTTHLLELYHGATGAFKDLAMSAFAGFVEHISSSVGGNRRRHVVALVCTTGDTGPAALASFANCNDNVSIINMYARGWCTRVQQLQMLKCGNRNAYIWEFDGSPDIMDRVIAKVFRDAEFLASHPQLVLVSVNSVNWFRVMYQAAHYFWTFFQFYNNNNNKSGQVSNVRCYVPTSAAGAGHITGGVVAKLMGLPIELVAVVNENDILYRMLHNSSSSSWPLTVPSRATTTLATAMDGVFPYNFERLLYFAANNNAALCRSVMQHVVDSGQVLPAFSQQLRGAFARLLRVERVGSNDDIGRTMRHVHSEFDGRFVCPHTACAVCVALRDEEKQRGVVGSGIEQQQVCFATARAEKFAETVERVGLTPDAAFEEYATKWVNLPTRAKVVKDDLTTEAAKTSAVASDVDKIVEAWCKQLKTIIVNCIDSAKIFDKKCVDGPVTV